MGRARFFILFMTLTSCGMNQEKSVTEHTICDSVFTIIKEKNWEKRFDQLGIKSIEESISKTQIRIWTQGVGSVDSARLLILRKDEAAWTSEFHQYRFSGSKDSIDILVNHEVTKANPKSGWKSYIADIEKKGIYTLNDKDRKKSFGNCNHGESILVQIVNDGKCFEYFYPCWTSTKDKTSLNKIVEILEESEKQFGYNIFPLY